MTDRLVVGLGARPDTAAPALEAAIRAALAEAGLSPRAVGVLATLDRRAAEEGVRALAAELGWELTGYPAGELAAQRVVSTSETVAAAVGTPSVAEAAALAAAGPDATLVVSKRIVAGVTVAVARPGSGSARSRRGARSD